MRQIKQKTLKKIFFTNFHGFAASGFTLMELMVASGILAVALLALLGTFAGTFGLIESSRNLTAAINHAQCVMEEIRDYNIPTIIVQEDWTGWAHSDPPNGGGCNTLDNETVQVIYPQGEEANPLEIVVRVNWTEKGRARNTQLVSLLTER